MVVTVKNNGTGLPSLNGILKGGPDGLNQQVLLLWTIMDEVHLFRLPPEQIRGYARQAPQTDSDVDAAYLWVLHNVEGVAGGSKVSEAQFSDSIKREAAVVRLQQAGIDLAQGVVDDMYLIRAGLYAIRLDTDKAVAGALADDRDPARHWTLSAAWQPVAKVEAQPVDKAQATKKAGKKAAGKVQPGIQQAGAGEQDLQDIERLLAYARQQAAPGPDGKAEPGKGAHGKKQ